MTKDKTKPRLLSDVTDTILKKANFKKKKNLLDSDLNLTRANRASISEEVIEDIKLPDLKLENIFDKKEPQKLDASNNVEQSDKIKSYSSSQSNSFKVLKINETDFFSEKDNNLKKKIKSSSKKLKKDKTDFVDKENQNNTINPIISESDNSQSIVKQENKKFLKNKVKNNKPIKNLDIINSSNESNLKKITILIDEQAINKKVSQLHKEATSFSLLKIKKNKKTKLPNKESKLVVASHKVFNYDEALKTSELITYSNNNRTLDSEPYPFSLDNIEILSADRKSSNYKEFSDLKNLNEIQKEKLELIKKKYNLKKEIKTLIDESNDFSFKNKLLTEKLFLDSNKKKEVLKIILEQAKVNPNYDSLRHQIGKLTIYLENLKTLLNDIEFDISMNNLSIDEGSQLIQDLESKIYIAQFLLDKLRNKN